MLIRSQNKLILVNIDNIDTISCNGTYFDIYSFSGEGNSLLGRYSTGEKAIKVLDMIQEAYEANKGYYLSRNKSNTAYTFYMPQDDEVIL